MLLQRTTVLDHLEAHVGRVARRWPAEQGRPAFDVVSFPPRPGTGTVVFSTLGLSGHPLTGRAGRTIRHELVFAVHERYADAPVPAMLRQVGDEAVDSGFAYLRGQVLGPRGPLFEHSALEALYLMPMVLLPPSFDECVLPGIGGVAWCWLVPLHPWEVAWREACGWSDFEDALVDAAPDLTDLARPPFLGDPDTP